MTTRCSLHGPIGADKSVCQPFEMPLSASPLQRERALSARSIKQSKDSAVGRESELPRNALGPSWQWAPFSSRSGAA